MIDETTIVGSSRIASEFYSVLNRSESSLSDLTYILNFCNSYGVLPQVKYIFDSSKYYNENTFDDIIDNIESLGFTEPKMIYYIATSGYKPFNYWSTYKLNELKVLPIDRYKHIICYTLAERFYKLVTTQYPDESEAPAILQSILGHGLLDQFKDCYKAFFGDINREREHSDISAFFSVFKNSIQTKLQTLISKPAYTADDSVVTHTAAIVSGASDDSASKSKVTTLSSGSSRLASSETPGIKSNHPMIVDNNNSTLLDAQYVGYDSAYEIDNHMAHAVLSNKFAQAITSASYYHDAVDVLTTTFNETFDEKKYQKLQNQFARNLIGNRRLVTSEDKLNERIV